MKILITGPQGCGKSTQAQIIAEKYNLCFVDTGDLIREFAKGRSEEAVRIKRLIEAGEWADDRLASALIRGKLKSPACKNGFVADGYPRRLSQLYIFDPGYDLVFDIEIPEEESLKRLISRRRHDDKLESIEKRLEYFNKETVPVLNYYKELNKLVVIDGMQTIEEVAVQIERYINEWQK